MIFDYKDEKKGYNWVLAEDDLNDDRERCHKIESLFCQGNGYMCVRAVTEETDIPDRYTFVAGVFDLRPGDDCNALANFPDTTNMSLKINGCDVSYLNAAEGSYLRTLDLSNGLLERKYDVVCDGGKYSVDFRRFVSLSDLHLLVSSIRVMPDKCDGPYTVSLSYGIDGDTIPKKEHLADGIGYSKDDMNQVVTYTNESGVNIVVTDLLRAEFVDCQTGERTDASVEYDRKTGKRSVMCDGTVTVPAGKYLELTKYSGYHTTRERGNELYGACELSELGFSHIGSVCTRSFCDLFEESSNRWYEKIWKYRDAVITGEGTDRDQISYRFAVYHLTIMTPVHDNRMNIGAKGMSGPGYNGHAFWDTEMYMLPYFIFTAPEEAKSLVEYRYNCLPEAKRNAKSKKCLGAKFFWESAWITDGEVTPVFCDEGDYQIHITSDVVFGAIYYYIATGDQHFMDTKGYELVFECALYWATAPKPGPSGKLELRDVIGPNENHEHINNNAYTNYFAKFTCETAMHYYDELKERDPGLFRKICDKVGVDDMYDRWKYLTENIYLPVENEDGLIPEHEGFLELPSVLEEGDISMSLTPAVRARAEQLGFENVQLSKQADVTLLMFLLEDLFTPECKKKNFYYYERCCTHGSSLSLNTYSCIAADLGEDEMAYRMFERAEKIDLNGDPYGSGDGIHSASLGGIWQCTVIGFGGIRRYGEDLRIEPNIPEKWKKLEFNIIWKSHRLHLVITHDGMKITDISEDRPSENVSFLHKGKRYEVNGEVEVAF